VTLPDVLIVGPMRAGTSWIQDYLRARGDVGLPAGVKETFFFDRHFHKGPDWYARHFRHTGPMARRVVEVGPSYFHCPQAPARIHAVLGDIPLVVTLRDPVRRAWSHYLHLRRYGYTRAPLRQAVADFPEILEASRYRTRLAQWHRLFPPRRIHVLTQEALAQSVQEYAARLCTALSIPYAPPGTELLGRRNEVAAPPSPRLAALGERGANLLRANRLYAVVNLAKRLGLKSLFYGRPGTGRLPALEEDDARWLATQLEGEAVEAPPD
jgi:hypothetical protein